MKPFWKYCSVPGKRPSLRNGPPPNFDSSMVCDVLRVTAHYAKFLLGDSEFELTQTVSMSFRHHYIRQQGLQTPVVALSTASFACTTELIALIYQKVSCRAWCVKVYNLICLSSCRHCSLAVTLYARSHWLSIIQSSSCILVCSFEIYGKWSVQTNQQAYTHSAQCSHTSVGLAQACPN